ncbi:MAG: hypothetical protein CVT49_13970 [candidate division Zixibacteria bacterium HGW-Zixibacteria-1]|nr:MAG: hypothetical protein CVT49_13970 [candidate division Zixibacteria bacterium HGW-Zixibacteria-1]
MRKILQAAVLIILLTISVRADDLYLLEITSRGSLDVVKNTVDYAHGVIDDRFIVYIDADQYSVLQSAGVELELLAKDCRLEDYYLILEEHNRVAKSVVSISAVYETAGGRIAELEESSTAILGREGFMVFPLFEKNTPFFYNAPTMALPMLDDYPTDTLAALISEDSLYNYINRMEAFYTRFTPSDSCINARNWIKNKLASFGYTGIQYQFFLATREWQDVINVPAYNVVCSKIGTEKPDKWIIIGGHYDSYAGNDIYCPAPGADDNASGTSAMLELARIFNNVDFKRSLMFVAFGAEEQYLIGSDFMAENMHENSIDIELVVNFDVIAYEDNTVPDFFFSATQDWLYGNIFLDAAARLTDLIPYKRTSPLSDDRSFSERGYHTVATFEYTFHSDMHSPFDILTSINIGYMAKMIRMAAAAIPIIDKSADPVICDLYDIGDGHSLRVMWDSCFADCSYQVLYGPNENSLTETVDVPSGQCFCDITGLTEGQYYYFSVKTFPNDGYPPLLLEISSERPLSIPRQPAGLDTEPLAGAIMISWNSNIELDLSHYRLLRTFRGSEWAVHEDNLTGNEYVDEAVLSGQEYMYCLLAVDNDSNESDSSLVVSSVPAFFDQGVLLVDETQAGDDNPSEAVQYAYFQNLLSGIVFERIKVDSTDDAISRTQAGQYNPIIWVDDDDYNHVLSPSLDTLEWYFGFDTDFLLAGWKTIYTITGQSYFYPGSYYYDNFGISYIAQNPINDFTGATGVNGWPDVEVKPDAPGGGRMPNIDIFTAAPNAEVIMTFNSASSNQFYSGKPVGIAYDTHHGKRVILGFPIYYLTDESAQALIAKVFEYFGEESVLYGDANGDWAMNLLDITYLINYLYKDGPEPIDLNNGDPNRSCAVNILDVTYLINYLYKSGPEPVPGCVN